MAENKLSGNSSVYHQPRLDLQSGLVGKHTPWAQIGIRPLNCVDSFSSNFKSHCDSGPPGKGLYDPCRFPTQGARICAPVLAVSEHPNQVLEGTYSFKKCSALVGSVKIVPSICLSPASPPSNRPSSTSVATPAAIHRLIQGTAMAMFSSSVYMSATVISLLVYSRQRGKHQP